MMCISAGIVISQVNARMISIELISAGFHVMIGYPSSCS